MSYDNLPRVAWPVYGALINSTRGIIEVVDEALTRPSEDVPPGQNAGRSETDSAS